MLQLVRNVRLAAGTVADHGSDDPMVLVLLLARRLPRRVADPVARVVGAAGRLARSRVLVALAALMRGNPQDVRRIIDAASFSTSPTRNRWLADIALAAGLPEFADSLLERVPVQTRGRAGSAARRLWYDGAMSAAAAQLEGIRGYRAQENRLRSELEVFQDWAPFLDAVPGYQPAAGTVLHVLTNSLPHTASGYAQRTHSILYAQRNLGWNVHAVTRLGYPVQVGKLLAHATEVVDGITYHRLLPGRLHRGMSGRLQQQTDALLVLCLQLRPSILHTTTHFVNGLAVQAVAEALGIPWVYEVRGQLADTWASSRGDSAKVSERYKLFNDRETRVMHQANLIVTLGEAMKREIIRKGIPEDKVVLCPNAVGEQYLDEPVSPPAARLLLGLPENGTFIGTVSSLLDYEGLDDLLRAFALLAPHRPELRCLIVGDGAAAPALLALALELGISARTIFTGRVPREQARLHHQALDIFVVPRKDFEVTRIVTPLKPVEALACGRPVVASDLPALRELVDHGATGLLVPAESPEALAEAIETLIDDEDLRRTFGTEGRRRVLAERTWAAGAQLVTSNYARLSQVNYGRQ